MKLLTILFLLLPTSLFSQEYHIRGCDSRFYKMKTRRIWSLEGVTKYKYCAERWRWPDGKYYFYHDTDTLLRKPYQYQVYKNGSSTYRKRVGNRKEDVFSEFGYFEYYDNGNIKNEKGCDTAAFNTLKNVYKYYDSLENLASVWRSSFKGLDEHGRALINDEFIKLDKGDTVLYSLGYDLDENLGNHNRHFLYKIKEYDTLTRKLITEKKVTEIYINDDLNFCCESYWLKDTIALKFNARGEVLSKIRNVDVNTDKYSRKESYINDSMVYYHFELKQDFNFNDSGCNYAEFYSNGMPQHLKMSYCGQDTLITKYDSTGEETYREEFFVTKDNRTNRLTYLFKPTRERYLIKKEVCKRRRCIYWLYNEYGELVKVKRYKKRN
jgi:hypothetical protein